MFEQSWDSQNGVGMEGTLTDICPFSAEAARFQSRGDSAEELGTGGLDIASLPLLQAVKRS